LKTLTPAEADERLRRAIQGDRDALGGILMDFKPVLEYKVHQYLSKFRLESHVDDLVQDIYVEAIAGFGSYDPIYGSFNTRLRIIAYNNLVRWARDNPMLLREVPLDWDVETLDEDDDIYIRT
jgi:DNA-directed RNA polymerase specialized sigma24 family protein